LDQFEKYSEYIPAEQIESAGVVSSLISKILFHEGTVTNRPVVIGKGKQLYECLSKSADTFLAEDPEMLARERELDDFSKTVRNLLRFNDGHPPQKEN